MREFDDIRQLIEEQTQNPYEREALKDVVERLSEGILQAAPRDAYREELRQQLLAEAAMVCERRRLPWFRQPLAMSAAAAVVVALVAGATALRLQDRRGGAPTSTASLAAREAPTANEGGSIKALDKASQGEPSMGVASLPAPLPAPAGAGPEAEARAAAPPSGAATSRGLVRPAQRADAGMVRVDPGAATFQLEAALPAVPTQLPAYHMRQLVLAPADIQAMAGRLSLPGDVQQGYGHLWVGEASKGASATTPDLPPYKVPGLWLVASPDWGNGWTYTYRVDGLATPAAPASVSRTEAENAVRSFLHQVELPGADDAKLSARQEDLGTYWVDFRLVLDGTEVTDAGGALRLDQAGRVVYASWPALSLSVRVAGSRPVIPPEEAVAQLRSLPFDWYSGGPKLMVTKVALVYRWPLLTAPGREAGVDPAYEFTVHDADGNQSVLYVSAWH
ncbi:MAG: hypothetical protein M1602_02805 [Firmicutes bacterium]|nr:hypothetical protein [Bacillota bacterium]